MKHTLIILFLTVLFTEGNAQEWTIKPISEAEISSKELPIQHATRAEAIKSIRDYIYEKRKDGYLAASLDSTIVNQKEIEAYIYLGAQYNWGNLKACEKSALLNKARFRERLFEDRVFDPEQMADLFKSIVEAYENSGYPFASVRLNHIDIQQDHISACLDVQKKRLVKIDSIIIKGNASINSAYIHNYIGIQPGDLYNQSLLNQIPNRISEIPFLKSIKPPEIEFSDTRTALFLYLEKKEASQFNGILGILPDNNTGKILITGDARVKLLNALSRGELLDFNWRKLQTLTQDLKARVTWPYLFKTPFGIDLQFHLYKRDTTFIDLQQKIGIQYLLRGNNYIKGYYEFRSLSLLNPSQFANASTLPPNADATINSYGLDVLLSQLDYNLNPTKGYSIAFNGGAGTKKIKELPDLNQELYNDITFNSIQLSGEMHTQLFIPILKRGTVLIESQSALIWNENMFNNELFRIGGIHKLRGFDEESIQVSSYAIGTVELRYLLEQNSNIYLFFDQAYYERDSEDDYTYDWPYGFGGGIRFQTGAGIFSINYALGSQQGNPVQFRSAKIHFGFVNIF